MDHGQSPHDMDKENAVIMVSFTQLFVMLRVLVQELLGADYCEHNIFHSGVGVSRAVSALGHSDDGVQVVGKNQGKSDMKKEGGAPYFHLSVPLS